MVKIGNIKLSSPIILAPMAGISSCPYRTINRKMGIKLAYTEMISARALSYLSKGTQERLRSCPDEGPLGIQLLGKDICYMQKALEKLSNYKFDTLDFNAACPQKKVTNNGKGAYLLKEPQKLNSLLKCLIRQTSKPITLKMRLGWNNSNNALDIAKGAADCGISAIYVHGRTRNQEYCHEVDYASIAKIKKSLKIPVIGSGNILSAELAMKMFNKTKVDAIMVARGALGNPWIFQEINKLLKNDREISRPITDEIAAQIYTHFELTLSFFGEKTGIIRFRKFFLWYARNFIDTKHLKAKISQVKTKPQMLKLINLLTQKRISGYRQFYNKKN